MKRYLLFAFDPSQLGGGWDDFKGSFDTIEDAQNEADKPEYKLYDVIQIVDSETGQVYEGNTCKSS